MAKTSDCLIIGGGVIGLTIARRLARERWSVTLLERGACGREASWAGAGVISPCNPHRGDPLYHFHERSLSLYDDFCKALHEESGIDPEHERCGELNLLFDDNALRIARSVERISADRTMPDGRPTVECHTPEETTAIEPAATSRTVGSLEWRQSAQVRNPRLLQALRAACDRAGVEIHEDTPAVGLLTTRERVTGVASEAGKHSAGCVILCAGAWSSRIDPRLERVMPVHPVRGQIVLMKLDQRPFRRVLCSGKTYLVPRRDGHVLLGATEEPEAGYQKRNTAGGIYRLIEEGLKLAPMLAGAPVVTTWSGLRPGTPDDKPYLGPVPGFDGLIAATGHYRTGLTLAPATAEAIAAMLGDRSYDIDLACCRPGRWQ